MPPRPSRLPGARGTIYAVAATATLIFVVALLRQAMECNCTGSTLIAAGIQPVHAPSAGMAAVAGGAESGPRRGSAGLWDFRAAHGQDKWLMELYGFPQSEAAMRERVFIEAGLFDGYVGSNMYVLEKELGWRGLCFEPNRCVFLVACGLAFVAVHGMLGTRAHMLEIWAKGARWDAERR